MVDKESTDSEPEATNDLAEVEWEAPEFIFHEKSLSWYVLLAVGAVVFAAIVYLISKDLVSVFVILVVAIIFGFYGANRPKQKTYKLDDSGLYTGPKLRTYGEFKSFSVKPEDGLQCLTFTPLKRFSPYLIIYYLPKDEKAIMSVLSTRMPYEEPKTDAVNSLMRKMRL